MASLYHCVPNTFVKWGHNARSRWCVCGRWHALAKNGSAVPQRSAYSMVCGAFATLPILLVWIYLSWVIVLLGR
jgi:membrane protein